MTTRSLFDRQRDIAPAPTQHTTAARRHRNDPPCHSAPQLFDSLAEAQHRQAAARCAVCPVRDACLAEAYGLAAPGQETGYALPVRPTGTWGGVLWDHGRRIRGTG